MIGLKGCMEPQVREEVVISKMAECNDLILNSKRKIVGSRITRKKVNINGDHQW